MIYKDYHVNMGGLVLCKKLLLLETAINFEKSYVFRWRREDKVYQSDRMFKLLTFIKKAIFIPHWNPVDIKEYKHLTGREFPS